MFNQQPQTERPCTACGVMTYNREFVTIRSGSPRPVLVAKCQGECETAISAREARMLKKLRKIESIMESLA